MAAIKNTKPTIDNASSIPKQPDRKGPGNADARTFGVPRPSPVARKSGGPTDYVSKYIKLPQSTIAETTPSQLPNADDAASGNGTNQSAAPSTSGSDSSLSLAGPFDKAETPALTRSADSFNYQFASVEQHVAAMRTDPLSLTERDLADCGLGPLLSEAMLIYLAKCSSYTGRHVSLQVRGDSECFKSMTALLVAQLHPQQDVIQRQNITWAAMMEGLGRGSDFRHTVLFLDENVESRKRDPDLMAAIRELTTKEIVTRTKMQRGQPINITLRGPTTLIDCMLTDTKLTDQDVNRFLVFAMPDDPVVRQAVCGLNAERFDQRGAQRRTLITRIAEGHQVFLSQLRKDLVVNKPTALTGSNVSPRFDSSVFGLVCTLAWLDQDKRELDADGCLTATVDDYEYLWNLLHRVRLLFPKSDLTGSATKILGAWQNYISERGNLPISTPELQIAIAPKMDPAALCRLLNELAKTGYAEVTGRGPHGVKFHVLTSIGQSSHGCNLLSKLPTPDSLRSAQSCAVSCHE